MRKPRQSGKLFNGSNRHPINYTLRYDYDHLLHPPSTPLQIHAAPPSFARNGDIEEGAGGIHNEFTESQMGRVEEGDHQRDPHPRYAKNANAKSQRIH
jgi:hypothetical protein